MVQQGQKTEDEAKSQAIKLIEAMRYADDQYLWINDESPNMVMHPFKPNLNGQNIASVTDPNGKALFVEMVKVVREGGKGFVHYQWEKTWQIDTTR
ncbi:MAG: cache domain-containing protein [Pseudomonadales bacterium]|nr:cache domain-containing protein [Pseudomonadales bacterium]